jgi:mono/diheme cytochrome c family protein
MKSFALLAAFVTVGLGLQNTLPSAVDNHYKSLQAAKGLKVEFSVLRVSGGAEKISFTYAKPNMYRIDSLNTLKVSDGKTLIVLDKKKNTYTESAPVLTPAMDADTWAWSGFFDEKATKDLSGWQAKGKRQIRGASLEEFAFKIAGGDTGSLYIDPTNGIAKGYSRSGKGGDLIIIANSVSALKEAPSAKEFAFVAGTATKEEPKPVAAEVLYAEISPIMAQRCNGCHSSANPKAGVSTDNYAGLSRIVAPGNSAASNFYKVISGPNPRMPKGGGKMTAEEIEKIKNWIDSGAKQ